MNFLPSYSPKFIQRDLLMLLTLALVVRVLAAFPQQQPNYMDASYSYVNALNLAQGRGFTEDFVWNYLNNPDRPPHPSHFYWMPLTSILARLGMALGGINYRAAQIPFVVLSALFAPLSYWTGYALSHRRDISWLSGFFAIFSGFYFPFWTAIDNFTPFAIAGSLALLFAWRGIVSSQQSVDSSQKNIELPFTHNYRLYLFIAGVFIGIAHLARADGPLLLIAIFLLFVLRSTSYGLRNMQNVLQFILFLALGYLLVMMPWFIRNWQVVGSILPPSGTQTIWLTGYDDLFSYNRELSAQTFFVQGMDVILQGRWCALTINLQTVLAVWGMIFLAPLALIGAWQLRWNILVQLAALYAALLFIAMTFVFAFPGARGGLFHSGVALLPFIYATAAVGLHQAVDWAAARRTGWNAQVAKRVFGVGLVLMAIVLSSFIYYQRVLKNNTWNNADKLYPAIADWITTQNPEAMVMIGNPPAYRYHGGGLSVIVPNETLGVTLQAIEHYGVDYLVLDANHPAPLTDLYDNPTSDDRLSLVQTFGRETASPIYVFKVASQ